jgi:PAS domain S-box-containing protein
MPEDTLLKPGNAGQVLTREQAEAILRGLAGASASVPSAQALPSQRSPAEHENVDRVGGRETGDATLAELRTDSTGPALLEADVLRGLVEAVPDALVVVDERGRMVLVNAQAEALFGYRRDELLGRPVELLVPERFRGRHVADRAAYAAAPHVRPMGRGLELFGRRRDGDEVPVEISLSPLKTESGLLVVASIRDVSERRRAEAQLRKLEARYRTLVEGIPAVTFMAALDEGVNELYVSPQVERLLGFTQKEWLENPVLWYTQLHPDDRDRWHQEFARTCATAEPFRSVYRFMSRDGKVVWVHGEAHVVHDDRGRPLFLQGVAFDITAIKEAEEELKALNLTLEQRVVDRTAQIEERSRELARSNQDLVDFDYAVAHDLREPLRTMAFYIQKLAERYQGQLDAQADDHITRCVNASGRMRDLISNLLAYSRVRTHGKEPVPTDSAAALAAACANLQATIDECGAAVTSEGGLPTVLADSTQLTQLFQNLLGNALRFRETSPPRIHVRAERQDDFWQFAVTDNGIGISAENLKRLFLHIGTNARLHSRTQYPGTGFGLAICKKIVERHGGRIWVSSAGPDQGSTFWFVLPARDATVQ